MRASVRAAFIPFTLPLEGALPGHFGITWMYPDVKNLVSTGLGNLIDPIGLALNLPFVHLDGTPATRAEIVVEWTRIKTLPPDAQGRTAAQLGHLYAKPHTKLRLTNEGIKALIDRKLAENETVIATIFREWPNWPADAQLATHSMAWACGPGIFSPRAGEAHWPKLTAALHAQDFATAAVECFMPEEKTIGGLRPRNRANRVLFTNASIVLQRQMDLDVLHYPDDLDALANAETQPELPADEDEPTQPSRRPPQVTDLSKFRKVYAPPPLRGQDDDPDDAA